jgi:hypothetical protein
MNPLRWLFRSHRAVAGLLLLASLVVGEAADMRHHLSEQGCAADSHGPTRDDNCTCAGLHAAPLAGHAPVALAPVAIERALVVVSSTEHASRRGVPGVAPRAPPAS